LLLCRVKDAGLKVYSGIAELKTQVLKYDKPYEKRLQSMVPTLRVVPSGSGEDPTTVSIAGFVVDARAKRKTFVLMNIEMQFIEKHKIMCPGVSALCSLHQCPHFSFHSVAVISCSWSWTRSFVLLWSGTLSKFEMLIWHPTSEKALNKLLDAKVDV
jgi:hypothetical protein